MKGHDRTRGRMRTVAAQARRLRDQRRRQRQRGARPWRNMEEETMRKTKQATSIQNVAPADPGPSRADAALEALWDRERELLAEINRIREPIEHSPDIETALGMIARREQAHRELEATRAVKRHLLEQRRETERRSVALAEVRREIAELEARLPKARERDAAEGSRAPIPNYETQVTRSLERKREKLANLEAGGEVPVERRFW